MGKSSVVVGHVITGHLDPLPHPVQVGEKGCPPKRSIVSVVLELKWNEYMHPLLDFMEEVSRSNHHPALLLSVMNGHQQNHLLLC